MSDEQIIVCVGAPFEEQRFYGPFACFMDADSWCTENLKNGEYTWLMTLNKPESINE